MRGNIHIKDMNLVWLPKKGALFRKLLTSIQYELFFLVYSDSIMMIYAQNISAIQFLHPLTSKPVSPVYITHITIYRVAQHLIFVALPSLLSFVFREIPAVISCAVRGQQLKFQKTFNKHTSAVHTSSCLSESILCVSYCVCVLSYRSCLCVRTNTVSNWSRRPPPFSPV